MKKVICSAVAVAVWTVCCFSAIAADEDLLAWWQFDEEKGKEAIDSISGIRDTIKGHFKYVAGVKGKCLVFDGYTTQVLREAGEAPRLVEAFTIEAWIAPQTYSWNWTGIVDQAGNVAGAKAPPGEITDADLKPGLFGATWQDPEFESPDGDQVLKEVDHEWTGGYRDWSARWRGYIEGPFTGEVTFRAKADNGVKLEIDGQVVIDGWGRDKARSGKISMVKGKKHRIVLSYFQDGDPSFLHLYWSWAGQAEAIVDRHALKHSDRDVEYVKSRELALAGPPKERQWRVSFGIDREGHIGMKLMVDGQLKECVSDSVVPLLKWSHIAGTFDKAKGINVYINGKRAGSLAVKGVLTPADGHDMLIGKGHKRMSPARTERGPSRGILSNMIFDGLIDEVKIYNRALSAKEIKRAYGKVKPKPKQPLEWRRIPTGPKEPGRFGAYYCKLDYDDGWDKLWRVGPYADILVRFDEYPVKLIFWRGTAYGAVWVTENDLVMGDQSLEATGGATGWGCAEHMSDKQCRYARVRIIENNAARAVVHWRYAINDIKYQIAHPDAVTGWGDWADEYYYIYPDAVATRYQILWSGNLKHEWQETIVLNQPGTRPEDNIELDALTLGNMNGESHTYSWKSRPKRGRMKPENPTIQITNLKSEYKPFIIFQPNSRIKLFTGGIEDWCHFPWWNHWPVSQLPNDGRRTSVPDRPAHSSLSQSIEDSEVIKHDEEKGTFTAVTLTGMTNKGIKGLVPLARSWNYPAALKVHSRGYRSEGYDRNQRAYVIKRKDIRKAPALTFELAASEESPVFNPAFVVKNWGRGTAALVIDDKKVGWGKDFRLGHRKTAEGGDLVVWLRAEWTAPIKISLRPILYFYR